MQRAAAIDPGISIATVYRTVRLFEEAGILERHDFGDGRARYEAAAETHHDHLIDVETGNVIEFVDEELEQLQRRIAEKLGFRLVDHRMELYGVALVARPLSMIRARRWRARRRSWRGLHRLRAASLSCGSCAGARSPWPRRFLGWAGAPLRRAGSRVEGAPLPRNVLFVANHLSWLDILAIGGAAPARVFVAKAEVEGWPVVGWLAGSTTPSSSTATLGSACRTRPMHLRDGACRGPRRRAVPGRDDRRRPRAAAVPAEPVRLARPAARPASWSSRSRSIMARPSDDVAWVGERRLSASNAKRILRGRGTIRRARSRFLAADRSARGRRPQGARRAGRRPSDRQTALAASARRWRSAYRRAAMKIRTPQDLPRQVLRLPDERL